MITEQWEDKWLSHQQDKILLLEVGIILALILSSSLSNCMQKEVQNKSYHWSSKWSCISPLPWIKWLEMDYRCFALALCWFVISWLWVFKKRVKYIFENHRDNCIFKKIIITRCLWCCPPSCLWFNTLMMLHTQTSCSIKKAFNFENNQVTKNFMVESQQITYSSFQTIKWEEGDNSNLHQHF